MSDTGGSAEWKSFEPFDIDDGELSELTPQEVFVLGAEWWRVKEAAERRRGTTILVHSANADRIRAILDRRGRRYNLSFMPGDVSESWMTLTIEAKVQ